MKSRKTGLSVCIVLGLVVTGVAQADSRGLPTVELPLLALPSLTIDVSHELNALNQRAQAVLTEQYQRIINKTARRAGDSELQENVKAESLSKADKP